MRSPRRLESAQTRTRSRRARSSRLRPPAWSCRPPTLPLAASSPRARDAPVEDWCSSRLRPVFANDFFRARLLQHRLDTRRFRLLASNHDPKSILAEAPVVSRRHRGRGHTRQHQHSEEAENSAQQNHQLEADDDERRPRQQRSAARVEAPLVSCPNRYRQAGKNARNSARQYQPSHRALRPAYCVFDFVARDRRERIEIADLRRAELLDRLRALSLIRKRTYDRYRAHAALTRSILSAFRSQTIPSLSSVIDMIGRNLENNENSPRNHAKLPTLIMISVIDGR